MTTEDERFDRGLARYRDVYGEDAVAFEAGDVVFFDLMIRQLFGEVWTRPGLAIDQRRLLVMGVLAAQAKWDVLQSQFTRALATGELEVAQVREVAIHLIPYVGYPSSSDLFRTSETAIAGTSSPVPTPEQSSDDTRRDDRARPDGRPDDRPRHRRRVRGRGLRHHSDAVAPRVAAGAVAAASPAEAAVGATVVGVVVLDDAQALAVVDGPDGVLRTLEPGASSRSTRPSRSTPSTRCGGRGAPRRGGVDAGISGGVVGAQAGTLLSLVGGPGDAVDQARPVLLAFSKEVLHAGPAGAGMALKLARNAVGYAWMYVVHEAAELAHRSGVDLALLERAVARRARSTRRSRRSCSVAPSRFPPTRRPSNGRGRARGQARRQGPRPRARPPARLGVDLPGLEVVRRSSTARCASERPNKKGPHARHRRLRMAGDHRRPGELLSDPPRPLVLGWDREAGTLDLLIRFDDKGGHCQAHRHVSTTSVLVLEGEQHLDELRPDGERVHKVRTAGTHHLTTGDAVPAPGARRSRGRGVVLQPPQPMTGGSTRSSTRTAACCRR